MSSGSDTRVGNLKLFTALPRYLTIRLGEAMRPECPALLSYEDSCRLLMRLGCLYEGDYGGNLPILPDRRPQSGDDLPHGVRFFRTWVGSGRPFGLQTPPDFESKIKEHDLENLTLPRTFFGRSEISRI